MILLTRHLLKCHCFNRIFQVFAGSENDSSFCGKANRQRGWALVETHRGERKTVETLIHEVGHLFNAKHIYLDDAFMHPYDSSANIWTAKTRETILTNKYRTWEWTD